jgi:hypothetical protein
LGGTAAVHLEMPQSYGISVQLFIGVTGRRAKCPSDASIQLGAQIAATTYIL